MPVTKKKGFVMDKEWGEPESILSILKYDEKFIMNGQKYYVQCATTTHDHLEEVMSDVALELLPEPLYLLYKEMLMEVKLMRRILGRR